MKLNLEHESIWVFLRTIIAHEALHHDRTELCSTLQEYIKELERMEEASELLKRVNNALEWIEKYGAVENKLNGSS
jgi:LPS sulfotransferase NodH